MIVVVAFALYYLLSEPAGAADVVRDAFDAVIDAFANVGVFVENLLS